MSACVFWAIVLGVCVLLLFIPDKWINTRTRKNNGLVLLVIIASLAGMQSYYQITAPALLLAFLVFVYHIVKLEDRHGVHQHE